jgi:predicted amidohydrolase
MVRVAVIQIESSCDTSQALDACTRSIDRAVAEHTAQLIVFPQLSLDDDDELAADSQLGPLRERALQHQVWLLGSVLHRGLTSSAWCSPDGVVSTRVSSDLEQTGSGAFTAEAAVIQTPHGKIGLSTGQHGLHYKVARGLAQAGAELVCVSLALHAELELTLRLPARAVENQTFLAVAAHLDSTPQPYPASAVTLPPELPGQSPQEVLGEPTVRAPVSQIYTPLGAQVACGDLGSAELDLPLPDHAEETLTLKTVARRPDLYRGFPRRSRSGESPLALAELDVATLAYSELGSVSHAISWAREHLEELAEKEVGLVVLPELFCFDPNLTDLHEAASADFATVVQALSSACRRSPLHVVTSLVEQVDGAYYHVGLVIGQAGIVLRQAQLHVSAQHAWARPGHRLESARMPWGRLGLVVGDDVLVPEVLDGLGRAEVELVAAPLSTGLSQRAALTLASAADEAGYAVLGATRPTSSEQGVLTSSSFVVDPSRWPVQRALESQEVLRATVRLAALRSARQPPERVLRAPTRGPALALD